MISILCILSSILVFALVLSPFLIGPGGKMFAHSSLSNEESLLQVQKTVLANYLKCEQLFEKNYLSKREWEQRQSFLTNRYLDTTRRLDAMRFQKEQNHAL